MSEKHDIKQRKEEIRKEIIWRLGEQELSLIKERSLKIQKELLSSEEFKVAETVMTYVSLPKEVDTTYIIEQALEQRKRVVVPYIEPGNKAIIASEIITMDCLAKGPFGIRQPKKDLVKAIPLEEIDLVLVPAIAYDKRNMRLGRGKGYYDNFLAQKDLSSVKTIGLAFRFQIKDTIPSSSHDIPVHRVITD